MSHPKVSVVVPTYNVESWLDDCLLSLRAQTYTNLEILVVNDGSTDASPERARHHAELDDRIRVIDQANAGLGGARNTGIDHVSGALLTFVDSDDFVTTDFVEKLVAAQCSTGADVVSCRHAKVSEDALFLSNQAYPRFTDEQFRSLSSYAKILGSYTTSVAWGRLFRTEFIVDSDVRFPPRIPHEDLFFTYKMVRSAAHEEIDDTLYFWRQRDGSLSRSVRKDHLDVPWQLRDDTSEFLGSQQADQHEYVLAARRNLLILNHIWDRAAETGGSLYADFLESIGANRQGVSEDLHLAATQLSSLCGRSASTVVNNWTRRLAKHGISVGKR